MNRREVPDFDAWLQCFSMYAAVICSKYPGKAKDLWAYQAFMVTEYRKCGGRGWLIYDSLFRQQLPSIEAAEFGRINQSLYSTTFLAHRGRTGQFCYRCSSSDHSQEECALHPNRGLQMVQVHSGPVQAHSGSSPLDKDRGAEAEERAPRSLLRVQCPHRLPERANVPLRARMLDLWRGSQEVRLQGKAHRSPDQPHMRGMLNSS